MKTSYDRDAMYDIVSAIEANLENVQILLTEIRELWMGHYLFGYKALTPGTLQEIYNNVNYVKEHMEIFYGSCDDLGGLSDPVSGNTGVDYERTLCDDYRFELTLIEFIIDVYSLSVRYEEGDEISASDWALGFEGIYSKILSYYPVVTPWDMPESPELDIPEKSAVVLDILDYAVSDKTQIAIGLKDIFGDILMGVISVDEPVSLKDRVIVRAERWDAEKKILISADYDGVAESDCPVSEFSDVLDLTYDFDIIRAVKLHNLNWRKAWINAHWTPQEEVTLRMKAREYMSGRMHVHATKVSKAFEEYDENGELRDIYYDEKAVDIEAIEW